MELNKIQSIWDWGAASSALNSNFEKIKLELMKLRFASILTFCKGYFSAETRFLAKFPSGKTGEYAFVGTPWPGTVYEWIDTKWVDTKVAPQLGEGIFVELLKQHIDNNTVYWDDANKVIKAKGGGGGSTTHEILLSINPDDVNKCTVEVTGAVFSVTTTEDKGKHTILGVAGGGVTVRIVPNHGFIVDRLNVDKVSQGAINSYTFDKLDADHTMYAWMTTELAGNPKNWLERSDLPGTYYSSYQEVFDAIKIAYPSKITQDITITCVKNELRFKRDRSLWVAEITKWNKNSIHMLTIDGMNNLTLDCGSLGGFNFDHVDNVVVKNISFVNVSNYSESNAPEEVSAINFTGDVDSYSRNLYVESCVSSSAIHGRYAIIAKYAENVYLMGNQLDGFNCISLKIMDCRMLSLVKNYINAANSYNIIGHPALCTISNCQVLIAEDNEFTGTTGEYFFYLTNVERIFFRRNNFHDGGGEGIKISSKIPLKEVIFESNLFVNLLMQPTVAWGFHYIVFECNAEYVSVLNNTAYISSGWWQQWFLKAQGRRIGVIDIYNNIIVSAVADTIPMRGIALGEVDQINSGNNVYQVPLQREGVAKHGFFSAVGLTDTLNLASVQGQGVEVNSQLVSTDKKILQKQNGGASYKLLDIVAGTYPSDGAHYPGIDYEYKQKADVGNSCGCYNLTGTAINESNDSTIGYEGKDLVQNILFASDQQFTTDADNLLIIKHKSLDRSRFVKMTCIGSNHSAVVLGKYGLLKLIPTVNVAGEYVEDEVYDITIK